MAIETISYTISAFVYLVFFAVLLTDKHRGRTKQLLLAATFSSAVWSASISIQSVVGSYFPITQFFEICQKPGVAVICCQHAVYSIWPWCVV